MIQSYLDYELLTIQPFQWVRKIWCNQKGRSRLNEKPILEVIFVTFFKNSSVLINDTQGPGNTNTNGNICIDTSMSDIALNLPWYFWLLMGKSHGYYFQIWSPNYRVAQFNQETLTTASSWKTKIRITINTVWTHPAFKGGKENFKIWLYRRVLGWEKLL